MVAVGLIDELILAMRAPLGYQDESGFHFGSEQAAAWEQFARGNPP